MAALCPCQSGQSYQDCCQPFHQQQAMPQTAAQLMRSRYAAYCLQHIDYIVRTTLPAQQKLLDQPALLDWAQQTQWVGLEIVKHLPAISKIHSMVEFNAYFIAEGQKQLHHEQSLFVKQQGIWYFVDPTLPLPSLKQTCICGSGKKFKHCCGAFLCQN